MPQSLWEDPFVAALGVDWRGRCDSYMSSGDWQKGRETFLRTLCELWGLPCWTKDNHSREPEQEWKQRVKETEAEPPSPDIMEEYDLRWPGHRPRLKVILDCQPLVQILNGVHPIKHRPGAMKAKDLIKTAFDHMANLFQHGVYPQENPGEYFVWRRRELNKLADHIVNQTMDRGMSWCWRDSALLKVFAETVADDKNLIVFADGGKRGGDQGAAGGWCIFWANGGDVPVLWTKGIYLGVGQDLSAFDAETAAAEDLLGCLKVLMSPV